MIDERQKIDPRRSEALSATGEDRSNRRPKSAHSM